MSEDVTTPSEETKELTPETPSPETEVKELEEKSLGAAEEDVKDSWDVDDDVKDEWDASDEEKESGNFKEPRVALLNIDKISTLKMQQMRYK